MFLIIGKYLKCLGRHVHIEIGPVDVLDIWAILYLTSYLMGEGRGPKIVFDHFQYS
jgi:hypothetical protein